MTKLNFYLLNLDVEITSELYQSKIQNLRVDFNVDIQVSKSNFFMKVIRFMVLSML